AIATQECQRSIASSIIFSKKDKWEALLQTVFQRSGYLLLRSCTLVAIHLAVYIRRKFMPHITCIRNSSIATGFGNIIGNKGAVAVAFCLFN
ncbi:MAG: hypothetical protein EZS28_053668, partial [Streblomastix strix]